MASHLSLAMSGTRAKAANRVCSTGVKDQVATVLPSDQLTSSHKERFELSTTHVTSGGIFSIGLLRRHEADWSKVRDTLSRGWPRYH